MENFLNSTNLMIGVLVLLVLLMALVIYFIFALKKMKNRLDLFMGTKSTRTNIEDILIDYYNYVEILSKRTDAIDDNIRNIYNRLEPCVQKIGIVRYNPFDQMGGDLSYALALLDEKNNGFILNTIFSRESSHTYCKPLENGESIYPLSYEEQEAIKRALGFVDRPRGTESLNK